MSTESSGAGVPAVGVLGGTFDPVHNGHLEIARAARDTLGLDHVLFVPARIQPHKLARQVSASEHRWAMVLLALEGEEHLRASRVELDREGPSYTADTLRQLREAYGESARLYFICGADALSELETWYRPEVLLANASVAVARRAGCEASSEIPAVAERLTGLFGGHVVAFDAPLVNVSSTLIRNLVRKGQGAGQYLPAAVYQYVLANGLYLEGNCF